MKEVKKTAPAKKTNITRKTNTPKKPVQKNTNAPKNNVSQKSNVTKKAVVVNETKVVNLDEKDDKKLIIIIGISILIIIGTVIGLLIGCEKKEEKEPTKPKDDVITPVKVKEDDKEDDVVVKKTTVSTDTVKYRVKYYYRDSNDTDYKNYTLKVKFGKLMSKFVPEGYEDCSYYTDSSLKNKVNFKNTVKSNKTIYMVCKLIKHNVKYYDANGREMLSENLEGKDNNNYIIADGNAACPVNTEFLGWKKTGSSINRVKYTEGSTTNVRRDLELSAVCGKTTVTYVNDIISTEGRDGENVEETTTTDEVVNTSVVGYTESDLVNYDVTALTPDQVGLDTPTYFVPTTAPASVIDKIKTVVSDDTEEVTDTQIKISDIKNKPDWYTPTISDNVEEKDYEFEGWTKKEEDPVTKEEIEVPVVTKSDFTPDEDDETKNEVEANWDMQEVDKTAPVVTE